ncbi:beta-ketoacyl synthase [Gammaproteobacteria bacterium]|nr:beta-ketoacyl synthase [Gammaproteobacteria bacterium]
MSRLPVIVSLGGVNPAGRSSLHHGYRRMVIEKIGVCEKNKTLSSLRALMNKSGEDSYTDEWILNHSLIREIENNLFNTAEIPIHRKTTFSAERGEKTTFLVKKSQLPTTLPSNWKTIKQDDELYKVEVHGGLNVLLPDTISSKVCSAGQLPTGFDPGKLYQSRNHPRGLQLTIFAASDAVSSLGINWEQVKNHVPPDQISVYASSAMGQLDSNGSGGLLQAALKGKRATSKNLPLGLAEMTADFVNAYVLGNVGTTGANIGACATFLYNLRQGINDIKSGKYRVAIVGASEAPLTPEVIEGYRKMGALAEDEALAKIDSIEKKNVNHRLACRPFGDNCGFTLSEGSQFIILFDDALAVQLGAEIYGSVADVFVNADGFKKSIPGPGVGNYLTVGKAMGLIRSILGSESLQNRSYMQAHGTSTPQNRVTESHIFNELAKAFAIKEWPITAIKAYIGHSLACASADQLIASLGVWEQGIIPGITTTSRIAEDVFEENLKFLLDHREFSEGEIDSVFINSKGFGGNNATAAVLSPAVTRKMMKKKHGERAFREYRKKNQIVQENIRDYDREMTAGSVLPIYRFGDGVVDGGDLKITDDHISIPGSKSGVSLRIQNPFSDMTEQNQ